MPRKIPAPAPIDFGPPPVMPPADDGVEVEQLTTFDDRFYSVLRIVDGAIVTDYLPSVTTILGLVSVGSFLDRWREEQAAALGVEGARLDMLIRAERGKDVHALIERMLKGEVVEWTEGGTKEGHKLYDDRVWKHVTRFAQWYAAAGKPQVVATEHTVYSLVHGYAGTCDAVLYSAETGLTLCDWKTSKAPQRAHLLQIAAYRAAVEEMYGWSIDTVGVLTLGNATRLGYQFKALDRAECDAALEHFLRRLAVFRDEMPEFAPAIDILPVRIDIGATRAEEIIIQIKHND